MISRRKRLVLLVLFLSLVGCVFFLLLMGSRIDLRGYERIRKGMTLADVEKIFGGPPGNYGPPAIGLLPLIQPQKLPGEIKIVEWQAGDLLVTVFFDKENRVIDFAAFNRVIPSFLEKLRNWWYPVRE